MGRLSYAVEKPFCYERQIGVVTMGANQMNSNWHVVWAGVGRQRKRRHVQQIPKANEGMIARTG
jgi:hypothetical protein